MLPLLSWHLNHCCASAVPEPARRYLEVEFQANAQRTLLLTGELIKLHRLLREHGIPAIPFKGPILASSLYGNLSLRPFSDLDILFRRQDLLRAKDLLVSRGYHPWIQLTRAQERAHLRSHCAYGVRREGDEFEVSLQWGLTLRKHLSIPIDFQRLLHRGEPVTLGGATLPHLPPEELLVFLCVHGSRHLWQMLKWITDVAELIRARPSLDWDWLLNTARSTGSVRRVHLGLILAHGLLGAVLPEAILRQVKRDEPALALSVEVRQQLFNDPDDQAERERMKEWSFWFRMMERWRDRVGAGAHLVSTPTLDDWSFLPLPTALFSLYYFTRPIRLAGKWARALLPGS
jgi:hypothetical protein